MLEEQQRQKDKVKDRLDLIRQMKGERSTSIQALSISLHTVVSLCGGGVREARKTRTST